MTETDASSAGGGALGGLAARGAIVSLSGQAGRIGIQLLGIAVLARLLSPSDYGVVAMVMVFVSLGELFRDFGLSAAAVQSPTLSVHQRNNLFWANTAIGGVLMLLGLASAPLVAQFFSEPDITRIMQVLCVTFLLNGLATQYRASLNRGLRFIALAGVEIAAQMAGLAAGIGLALSGAGYWALVAVQLVQSASALILLVTFGRWRPGRPRRGQDMRGFWVFGWNLVGTQLLAFMTKNVDSLVIGRRFGTEPLGLYDRAYRILMVPLAQIRTPSTTVALPVLSRLADDPDRYARFLARGQVALGYSVVALCGYAAGAAAPLVDVFLGEAWSGAAPIFALLAVSGALQTLAFVGYWVYLSRGLTRSLFHYTIVSSAIRIGSILLGAQWGVLGVAWAVALAPAVLWPISLWWLSRITDLPLRALVLGGLRIMGMALSTALLVRIVVDHVAAPALIAAGLGALSAVALYGLAGLLVPSIRNDELALLDVVARARRHTS